MLQRRANAAAVADGDGIGHDDHAYGSVEAPPPDLWGLGFRV